MKGIILAGGNGTRLHPLTKVTNKHLLPVGRYPMIFYPIYKLKQAGIFDILVITGKDHMGDVVNLLGSGCEMDVTFTYKVQEAAGGIAQALGLAKDFVNNDQMVVILGDNIFEDDITSFVKSFTEQPSGAKLLLKEVHDPQRYGVAELDSQSIISIEEKPLYAKSNYAVTGVYMFDNKVFEIIKTLKPSSRGELEITDVNNAYIQNNTLTYGILEGWWTDAGTHDSLIKANELVTNSLLFSDIDKLSLKSDL